MKYNVVINSNKGKITIQAGGDQSLRQSLLESGVITDYPCKGRGVCRKCKAKLLPAKEEILLCNTYPTSDIEIEIPDGNSLEVNFLCDPKGGISIAYDIGTTTLEFCAIDESGKVSARAQMLNPQIAFGSDVLSRIDSCREFGVDKVRKPLILALNEFIKAFQNKYSKSFINKVMVCANTVLTHIFCGISPESMAKYPYNVTFDGIKRFKGEDIGIIAKEITVLPTFSAFLGSDVLVGLANIDILTAIEPILYIDLGTNGEITLFDGNNILSASTSAGPCFEGVNISCGMGGVKGAITSVLDKDGVLQLNVLGDAQPIGICGSGLISAISYAKDKMLINNSGKILFNNCIKLSENVLITQKDVNEFLLAKSAIRTGIDILLDEANLSQKDIKKVYVAGNLGQHAEVYAMVNCGLLPALFRDKIIKIGYNAIIGLEEYIKNPALIERINDIKSRMTLVDLSTKLKFSNEFTANMNFND